MSSIADQIAHKLATNPDPRVRNLAQHPPDFGIIGRLLKQHVKSAGDFHPRYLAPGRSGAKVLLITFSNRLPLVIKFGKESEIRREATNYQTTRVNHKISPPTRPELRLPIKFADGYASLAYEWAGAGRGARTYTLREAFQKLDERTLSGTIWQLLSDLSMWHDVQTSPQLPFDQWTWEAPVALAIGDILRRHESTDPVATRHLLQVMEGQAQWRDELGPKRSSTATCHGDMNCHNIVIASRQTGSHATIIDFASVCKNQSPARDWAKLERDIRLRCFFDAIPDPGKCNYALQKLEDIINSRCDLASVDENVRGVVNKASHIIRTIRTYPESAIGDRSEIARVEYAYFLLSWTLSYLGSEEYREKHQQYTPAIVKAAHRAYLEVERQVERASTIEIPPFIETPPINERPPIT